MLNKKPNSLSTKRCLICETDYQGRHNQMFCEYRCQRIGVKIQLRASYEVWKAVRRGDLPPAKALRCTDCGSPALEYDHRNYGKPLEVQPVCRLCNVRRGPALFPNYT